MKVSGTKLQHKDCTLHSAQYRGLQQKGRRGQKDAAKGLPGKGSIRRQDRTYEALGSVESTGAETGRLCKRSMGHEGQTVHNLETGRPDRAEGKGRKAGGGRIG